jgi:hypothetical protein
VSALPVDPITDPSAWSAIEIAGVEYPYVDVTGFAREIDWDKKRGKGAKGATTTYTGENVSSGKVIFYAWEVQHFKWFSTILVLLKYDPTKKTTQAAQIWHPALVENDINTVVAEKIGIWEHQGNGMYQRVVDFVEYRPPPPTSAVATPAGAATGDGTPGATPGTQPDPAIVAAQSELKQALADAKALGPP